VQFRFSQMTVSEESNRYTEFVELETAKRNRDPSVWSEEEDINLLKGFQRYGAKWQLIGIFFLPHRKEREMAKR
jgi:Myb-like DNA-binding domain